MAQKKKQTSQQKRPATKKAKALAKKVRAASKSVVASSGSSRRSAPAVPNPKRGLQKVRKEIKSIQSKTYGFNRKIKNAPNRYQAGKIKKQRAAYQAQVDAQLQGLVSKRSELKSAAKTYKKYQEQRRVISGKLGSIRKKIKKADENKDYKALEKLAAWEVRYLSELDKLAEVNGATVDKKDKDEDYDYDIQGALGGSGFELDEGSPYTIWEAQKQLDSDLATDPPEFKYYIIDGQKFPVEDEILITMTASGFWISSKKQTTGTPYINRYTNDRTKTVKYTIASM